MGGGGSGSDRYYPLRDGLRPPPAPSGGPMYRPLTPTRAPNDTQGLMDSAEPMAVGGRQPLLPTVEGQYGGGGGGASYGNGYDNGYGHGNGGYR